MHLVIVTARSDDRAILQLSGSVDLANRDELTAAGRNALRDHSPSALVIDLAEVSYLDSSGIGALVALAGESEDAGVGFSLQAPSPPVSRVLDICGLLRVWPIEQAT